MKASVPVIAPLLRSDVQGAVLAALLLGPQREFTLTELVTAAASTPPTVHREVERLVESGFALERRSGRNRYISANVGHRLYRPVKEIVEYAYGSRVIVADALRDIDGITEAFVFGSWAARMAGEPGMDPQDIDVLVVGRPDRGRLMSAADEATSRLVRCAHPIPSLDAPAVFEEDVDEGIVVVDELIQKAARMLAILPPYGR